MLTTAGRNACKEGTRLQQEAERELLTTLTRDEAHQLAGPAGEAVCTVESYTIRRVR